MNKIPMSIAAAVLSIALGASCQRQHQPARPDSVSLYTHSGDTLSCESGKKGVTIAATCAWTVASQADWIVASPESGPEGIHEVVLTYQANTADTLRSGKVVFTSRGGQSETYVLMQNPQE